MIMQRGGTTKHHLACIGTQVGKEVIRIIYLESVSFDDHTTGRNNERSLGLFGTRAGTLE